MIELFCKELPKFLSNSMYNEYKYLEKQVIFLITTYERKYSWVRELDEKLTTIKLILAMSVFYRRIIAQLKSAMDFTTRILNSDNCESLVIGDTVLRQNDVYEITLAIRDFEWLIRKYGIPVTMFDYVDATEFLKNVQAYIDRLNNLNDKN